MPKPRNAAIYVRISRDDGTALGVARQERDCRALAESKGWTIAEVITDNDVSAYSRRARPGYTRLIEGIESGHFDGLVIWHPDRLHRQPVELESFIELVEAKQVEIATVTAGEYDLTNADGRFAARITGAVARKESEDKSRRIRRKHQELAEQGKLSGGGRRPFGYEDDRLTIRPDEADLIREAVSEVLLGGTIGSIVTRWNRDGVATVTGRPWQVTTVKRLLCSGRIAGLREHRGQIVGPAVWPAIVQPDDHARLRAVLAAPPSKAQPPTARSYLLSGIIRCQCGNALTASPVRRKGNRYRRYHCRADRGGCNRVGIGAKPAEDEIVARLLAYLDSPATTEAIKAAAQDEAAPDPMVEVEALHTRASELADLFAAGTLSAPAYAAAQDSLERRLRAAQADVASQVQTTVPVAVEGLADGWDDLDLDAKRAIITRFIDHVTVSRVTRADNQFNPSRLTVAWH